MRAFLLFMLISAFSFRVSAQSQSRSLAEKVEVLNKGLSTLRTEKVIFSFIHELDQSAAQAGSSDWLPAYYAVLARLQLVYQVGLRSENAKDMMLELAPKLDKLIGSSDAAEAYILRAHYRLQQVRAGERALSDELIAEILADLGQAKVRQSENPRGILAEAWLAHLQAKRTDVVQLTANDVRPMLDAAIQKLEAEAAESGDMLLPRWGRNEAQELMQML